MPLRLALLILVAAVAALTFRDYGLGWDDYTHSQYGSLLLSLYGSGFADRRALSFVNLYMYGGGFDLLATLSAKILPFGLFETRRLVGAAVGLVGLFFTWRLGRRLGGPLAGLIALVLLATCPLYYGHMFMNAKDTPFAVTMAMALLGLVRAFQEYPRATPATIALCSVGIGLAVGSRVMGGFAVLEALLAFLFILAVRSRETGLKPALGEWASFLMPFLPGAVLAYLVMGLVWPWAALSPLNPFRAVEYFSNFFEKPWRELFDGQLIPVVDMPRSYLPTLIGLHAAGADAGARALRNRGRGHRRRARPAGRRRRNGRATGGSHCRRACRSTAGTGDGRGTAGHVQRHPPFRVLDPAICRARRPCRRVDRAKPAAIRPRRDRRGCRPLGRRPRLPGYRDGAAASL